MAFLPAHVPGTSEAQSQKISFAAIVGGSPRSIGAKPKPAVHTPPRQNSASPEQPPSSKSSGSVHTPPTPESTPSSPATIAKRATHKVDAANSPSLTKSNFQHTDRQVLNNAARAQREQEIGWTSCSAPESKQTQPKSAADAATRTSQPASNSGSSRVPSYAAAAMTNAQKSQQQAKVLRHTFSIPDRGQIAAATVTSGSKSGDSKPSSDIPSHGSLQAASDSLRRSPANKSPDANNATPVISDGPLPATNNRNLPGQSGSPTTGPQSAENSGDGGGGSQPQQAHQGQNSSGNHSYGYRLDFVSSGQRQFHSSYGKNDHGSPYAYGSVPSHGQGVSHHQSYGYGNYQQHYYPANHNFHGPYHHNHNHHHAHNHGSHNHNHNHGNNFHYRGQNHGSHHADNGPSINTNNNSNKNITNQTVQSSTSSTPKTPTTPSRSNAAASPALSPLSASFKPTSSHHFSTLSTTTLSPQANKMIRRIKSVETCGTPIEQTPCYEYILSALAHPDSVLVQYGYRATQFTEEELERKRKCRNCLKNIYNRQRKPRNRKLNKSRSNSLVNESDGQVPGDEDRDDKGDKGGKENESDDKKEKEGDIPKCKYHPGPMHGRYFACCSGTQFNNPCATAMEHVPFPMALSEMTMQWQLYETRARSPKDPRKCIAIDCEMGVSRDGDSELIRVTAIDYFTGEILIDKLVYPTVQMLHLNTTYSGVSWPQLHAARRQGQAFIGRDSAREAVMQYVNRDTIIVGHSVNHDLMALRWLHCRVVDTLLLDLLEDKRISEEKARMLEKYEAQQLEYEIGRRAEPPMMPEVLKDKSSKKGRSLKALSRERLNRVIQTGEHDSLEDTLASRDLLHWWIENKVQDLAARFAALKLEEMNFDQVDGW